MLGFNGGLIGVRRNPTRGSASGVWLSNEQATLQRVSLWPTGGDLFLALNGANGGTSFPDTGPNALAVTAFGNTQTSTAIAALGNSSALFDGDGDYLVTASSSELAITGDFTIEFWVYPLNLSGLRTLVHVNAGSNRGVHIYTDGRALRLDNGVVADFSSNSNEMSQEAWVHVAVCKAGSDVRVFRDGRLLTTRSAQDYGTPDRVQVCRYWTGGFTSDGFCHMSRLKVTRGAALYSAAFLPPTPISPLLLRCEGSNGSTAFINSKVGGPSVTAVNAVISTAQARFGGSSAFFNGTNAYLTVAMPDGLGYGNFTLEWWMYALGSSYVLFNSRSGGGSNGDGIDFFADGRIGTASFIPVGNPAPAMVTGSWQHFAVVRERDTLTRYQDGVATGSGGFVNDCKTGTTFYIGGSPVGNTGYFHGYLDEIRFTKSALYTAAFTPPTQLFPSPL